MLPCCGYYNLWARELNLKSVITEIYQEMKVSLAHFSEMPVSFAFPGRLEIFVCIWEGEEFILSYSFKFNN